METSANTHTYAGNTHMYASGQPVELTSTDVATYRYIAARGPLESKELIARDGREVVFPALEKLVDAGLVRRLSTGKLAAADPARVSDHLLERWEQRMRGAQLELLWAREQLAELGLVYASQEPPWRGPQLERLESARDVVRHLERHGGASRREVLVSLPGGSRSMAELPGSRDRERALLSRGLRVRTLHQHSARFDQPTVAYAEEATRLGAEIKTVTGNLPRFVVFDQEVLLVPLHGAEEGALVVRNKDLVAFAVGTFDRLWASGEPISRPHDKQFVQELADETKQFILQHLADGADDRATARALGVSIRTCQRHVSEIMRRLGATSRFQLGYLLKEKGLLDAAGAGRSVGSCPGGAPGQ